MRATWLKGALRATLLKGTLDRHVGGVFGRGLMGRAMPPARKGRPPGYAGATHAFKQAGVGDGQVNLYRCCATFNLLTFEIPSELKFQAEPPAASPADRPPPAAAGLSPSVRRNMVYSSRGAGAIWLEEEKPRSWNVLGEPVLRLPGSLGCRGCSLGCVDKP